MCAKPPGTGKTNPSNAPCHSLCPCRHPSSTARVSLKKPIILHRRQPTNILRLRAEHREKSRNKNMHFNCNSQSNRRKIGPPPPPKKVPPRKFIFWGKKAVKAAERHDSGYPIVPATSGAVGRARFRWKCRRSSEFRRGRSKREEKGG
jgi:hypothetical protein